MGKKLLPQENNFKKKITAVILCAGEGKRLKKITKTIPKPLIKIEQLKNKSILYHIINNLTKLEINKIAIVIGYLGDYIHEFISKLKEEKPTFQNNLILINTEDQYRLGPLYSFLSITRNKNFFNHENYYLLIPGDTIFDLNLLKEILFLFSKNFKSNQKNPFVFYRNIALKRLREMYKKGTVISSAELEPSGSEIVLKRIYQTKIKNLHPRTYINQLIPVFAFNYDFINEILNLKDQTPFTTVWEMFNHIISYKKKVCAFNIESRYQFFDIDNKKDLRELKKKRTIDAPIIQ